jgi:hypothetical protein
MTPHKGTPARAPRAGHQPGPGARRALPSLSEGMDRCLITSEGRLRVAIDESCLDDA